MGSARYQHTATLLPSGAVLMAAGAHFTELNSAELYESASGTVSPSPLPSGSALTASGSRFKGISEASGGNASQNSSSNYPLVQLRRLDNEQVLFLPLDPAQGWSDTSFTSATLNNFPFGPALVTDVYQRDSK